MEGFNKVDKKNTKVGRLRPKRPVGVLSEQEFRVCFHISDTIPIQLIDNEALSSIDLPNNMIYFTKEQFVARLCLPIPSLFKNSFISHKFLHFFFIRTWSEYWWGITCWTCSSNWIFPYWKSYSSILSRWAKKKGSVCPSIFFLSNWWPVF